MKAFWIIIGILLALIFLGILDRIRKERELLQKVKSSFGIQPEDASMSSERYASLSAYMQSLSETECDIDEITWNDLDMDRIFTGLNHTCSAIGEEVLFAYLHKPVTDVRELERREQLIQAFSDNEEHYVIKASVGISSSPNDGTTYKKLFDKADKKMYKVKRESKNTYKFH